MYENQEKCPQIHLYINVPTPGLNIKIEAIRTEKVESHKLEI